MGGIGFFLGIAVIALLARDLSGSDALSGLPPALGIAASALAAAPVSAWMSRAGRRPGLAAGHLCAATGCAVVLVAGAAESFPLLCLGTAAFGVGNTSNLLARYAGADLAAPERRGRAISLVLVATTVGAVTGPNLASLTAPLGPAIGAPPLAGPFVVAGAAYVVAAVLLIVFLRPDPLLVERRHTDAVESATAPGGGASATEARWPPPALVALIALVSVNAAMIGVMTMTPLHLDHAGQSLSIVGLIVSLHVAAMFLPSPLTGWLTDRLGRIPLIGAAAVVLVAAGAIAAPAGGHDATAIAVALVLLGLAWNLGLVSASALLTDSVPPSTRPRAQGTADLTMGMVGAAASVGSGAVLHVGGFALLCASAAGLGVTLAILAVGPARALAAR